MREEFDLEEVETYEPPVLAEAGEYAEVTNGFGGLLPDTFGGQRTIGW